MTDRITRRTILKGGAAVAGALALGNIPGVGSGLSKERATLVVFWLNGGPQAYQQRRLVPWLFGLLNATFAIWETVAWASLFNVAVSATSHMASINFPYGIGAPRAARCSTASRIRSQL